MFYWISGKCLGGVGKAAECFGNGVYNANFLRDEASRGCLLRTKLFLV